MGIFSSLNREQKEAIGLLQIGTFLEYFDLMLYVHMAVLLNDLFFPQSNPYTGSLLTATAFCSTFIFRPIGALFFGWIGDYFGRKHTIIFTTGIMAVSCFVMANLPTYAQWGLWAAWIFIICRVLQGISSMGEVVGAQIYLMETFKRPLHYPIVALLTLFAELGGMAALGIATLALSFGFNWRLAFWGGGLIAVISAIARRRLRETPEFIQMGRKWLKNQVHEMNLEADALLGTDEGARSNATWKEPIKPKTLIAYFSILCGWPLCFYMVYIYFIPVLKEDFGYSLVDTVKHNFLLSIVSFGISAVFTYLSTKIHPVKILKFCGTFFLFFMILFPFLISNLTSPIQIYLMQAFMLLTSLSTMPADPVFLSHLPFYRRVTCGISLFAISRALVHVITSFGLLYLGNRFGHFGVLLISLPITIFYLCGLQHFERLERKFKRYPNLS